jgi:hypothetical protein
MRAETRLGLFALFNIVETDEIFRRNASDDGATAYPRNERLSLDPLRGGPRM